MAMNPLYPCGKRCSTGTQNETVKQLTVFYAIINEIIIESRLQISNPIGMLSLPQFYHVCGNNSNYKSRCLIRTLGSLGRGPK